MNIFLDQSNCLQDLWPFTLTRHTADIRVGIFTIREKWQRISGLPIITQKEQETPDSIIVPANLLPCKDNAEAIIRAVQAGATIHSLPRVKLLQYPWHIFQYNDWALRQDFSLLLPSKNAVENYRTENIISGDVFIEEGAIVQHAILNGTTGPIYIGKNATVMEGCTIRGALALCEGAVLKMGSKIYGATTLGPHCVGAGEIKNSVLFAHSNKAHDGYLGDSVIGEWCNLGAGTSNSNVKNTGGQVKYSMPNSVDGIIAGNKAGLIMGDYSRTAINTSFNTGSMVGVCCNIFGQQPERFIKNFSWGTEAYIFEKALADIENWKNMKGKGLTAEETTILKNIYLNDTNL